MMVELWTRKREIGDDDENDMENTSGYEKSGVRLAVRGSLLIAVMIHVNRSKYS